VAFSLPIRFASQPQELKKQQQQPFLGAAKLPKNLARAIVTVVVKESSLVITTVTVKKKSHRALRHKGFLKSHFREMAIFLP
jgi:hypothetical protein